MVSQCHLEKLLQNRQKDKDLKLKLQAMRGLDLPGGGVRVDGA